jgi:WhiB family redox-sensing transcriptional regulator
MTLDWHTEAVCAQVDGDVWFPAKGDRHTAEKAKEFCATCPVAVQCLEAALANEEREGIWAGLNGDQLARLRRKKKRAA